MLSQMINMVGILKDDLVNVPSLLTSHISVARDVRPISDFVCSGIDIRDGLGVCDVFVEKRAAPEVFRLLVSADGDGRV